MPTLPGFEPASPVAPDTGPDPRWVRTLPSHLLYGVQFERELSDDVAGRLVGDLLHGGAYPAAVVDYAAALDHVVATGALPPGSLTIPHDEGDLVELLGRVRDGLEQHRPWPEPRWTRLGPAHWGACGRGAPVATVPRNGLPPGRRLSLDVLPWGARTHEVVMLRLRTGERVALVSGDDADPTADLVLRQPDPGDPARLVARFTELTGVLAVPLS